MLFAAGLDLEMLCHLVKGMFRKALLFAESLYQESFDICCMS